MLSPVADLGVDMGCRALLYGPVDLKSSAYVTCFNEDQSLRRREWGLVVDADGQASSANPSTPGPSFLEASSIGIPTTSDACPSGKLDFWYRAFGPEERIWAPAHTHQCQGCRVRLRTVKLTCRNHAALECQNA